jgi:hypothetical protein
VKLLIALVVATASGFIALSYEILWIRVYGFATEGEPQSFGFLLSAYLTGLALGALFARSYCQRTDTEEDGDPLFFVGLFFLIGNIAAFLVVPLTAELLSTRELKPEQLLPLFALAAAGLGTGFPLLSHYAIPADDHAGTRLSYLYVGNILGSTIGSLATGLWLLDVLSLRVLTLWLVLVGTAISCLLMAASSKEPQMRRAVGASYTLIAVAVLWSSPTVYHGLYEKLLFQDDYDAARLFAHTVENRSGVVNMTASGIVYGGGSYDGRPVIDPVRDAGVLDRILAQDAWRGGPTWEDRALILARSTDEAIITDDNMATEWWAFDTYP